MFRVFGSVGLRGVKVLTQCSAAAFGSEESSYILMNDIYIYIYKSINK